MSRLAVSLLVLLAIGAHASPYIPKSDTTVLEHLPAAKATSQLEPLRRRVRDDPQDLQSAIELAQRYLQIGRETADPRFVSYAQAVLAPALHQSNPPPAALVLAAAALQSSHRFDAALELLDRALTREPRNAQGWLIKATIFQVQGHFDEARGACKRLLQAADQMVALACLASVDSMTGRLAASYDRVTRIASLAASRPSTVDAWMVGQAGEMAMRLGDFASAELHFARVLAMSPDDVYWRAAYSDLLLAQGKNARVVDMLRDSTAQDVLLLRLSIAARRAGVPKAHEWADMFDARRRATRPDENPHLREHARFLLDVLDRPREALTLARANWAVQREPADVQLYLQASRRAQSVADERVVRQWIAETHYEDAAVVR